MSDYPPQCDQNTVAIVADTSASSPGQASSQASSSVRPYVVSSRASTPCPAPIPYLAHPHPQAHTSTRSNNTRTHTKSSPPPRLYPLHIFTPYSTAPPPSPPLLPPPSKGHLYPLSRLYPLLFKSRLFYRVRARHAASRGSRPAGAIAKAGRAGLPLPRTRRSSFRGCPAGRAGKDARVAAPARRAYEATPLRRERERERERGEKMKMMTMTMMKKKSKRRRRKSRFPEARLSYE